MTATTMLCLVLVFSDVPHVGSDTSRSGDVNQTLSDFAAFIIDDASRIRLSASYSAWLPSSHLVDGDSDFLRSQKAWILSFNKGRPSAVLLAPVYPTLLLSDGWVLEPFAGAKWNAKRDQNWVFWLDKFNIAEFNRPRQRGREDVKYKFDLESAVIGYLDSASVDQVTFDRASNSLRFRYLPKKYYIDFRRHTPVDQARTGVQLADFTLRDTAFGNSVYQSRIRAIQAGENGGVTFPEIDQQFLDRINAVDDEIDAKPLDGKELVEAGGRLWRNALLRRDGLVAPEVYERLDDGIIAFLDSPASTQDSSSFDLHELAADFLTSIRSAEAKAQLSQGNPTTTDPGLKWLNLVCRVSPGTLKFIYTRMVSLTMNRGTTSVEQLDGVFRFFDALGDSGQPDAHIALAILAKMPVSQISHIVHVGLRARWMLPVQKVEVTAHVDSLRGPPSKKMPDSVREFIVETLVRLDEADQLEDEDFDFYWNRNVESVSQVRRWEELSEIATTRSGRRQMLRQIGSSPTTTASHDAKKILVKYAQTSTDLKRWDFMSREECHSILASPATKP